MVDLFQIWITWLEVCTVIFENVKIKATSKLETSLQRRCSAPLFKNLVAEKKLFTPKAPMLRSIRCSALFCCLIYKAMPNREGTANEVLCLGAISDRYRFIAINQWYFIIELFSLLNFKKIWRGKKINKYRRLRPQRLMMFCWTIENREISNISSLVKKFTF